MPIVAIPALHFIKSVPKNYSDYQTAYIREFLQNSVDAGSKNIEFTFDCNTGVLTVSDDGCGMSSELLVSALLTMSGSHKGQNSIGGFGASKELILFSMESYEITTTHRFETTKVVGKQLEYEFEEISNKFTNGTEFTVKFHPDLDMYFTCFEEKAIDYLKDCEVSPNVYWNGELVEPSTKRGDLIDKGIDWANIYITEDSSSYACVRINGVKMFDVYVQSEYKVIIEITKPSTEILTVNRDGFTWGYQSQLTELICQIAIDKGNFGKAFNKHEIWIGDNRSYDDIEFDFDLIKNDPAFARYDAELMNAAIAKFSDDINNYAKDNFKDRSLAARMMQVAREKAEQHIIPSDLIDSMINNISDQICDHQANFYIKVTGKGIDKIPDHLQPGNWGKRTTSWAKLWKRCIKTVLKANKISIDYSIGWVIDDSVEAMYHIDNDVHVFYMNPTLEWMKSSNHCNVFMKFILLACHEVAHINFKYHDENFSSNCERIIHKTLCYINSTNNSWWKEYLASKKEVV